MDFITSAQYLFLSTFCHMKGPIVCLEGTALGCLEGSPMTYSARVLRRMVCVMGYGIVTISLQGLPLCCSLSRLWSSWIKSHPL